ncbi:hypothetical protein N0Y54_18455 [Nostoc punctiforme UO1]|uniref:hypothetical protein n=1 Tax=Nostoc punctiforme TaxID=272131 RepID=UPI0030952358
MPILSHVHPNTEVSFCIYPFVVMRAIAPLMSLIALVEMAIAFGLLGSATNFGSSPTRSHLIHCFVLFG